jgi:hypothetical protein
MIAYRTDMSRKKHCAAVEGGMLTAETTLNSDRVCSSITAPILSRPNIYAAVEGSVLCGKLNTHSHNSERVRSSMTAYRTDALVATNTLQRLMAVCCRQNLTCTHIIDR